MNKKRGLAGWLIQQAARGAPPLLAERLEEEWLADLAERQGTLARLRLAVGCCWATRVIAHEHCAASVAATATTTGSKTMIAYARPDVSLFSRRTISVLLILGLHVVIIYAFATGLARPLLSKLIPPIIVVPMPDPERHWDPPPLPQPTLSANKLQVDREPVDYFPPPAREGLEAQPVLPQVGPTLPVSPELPPRVAHREGGGPGKGFPHTDDFYPANALRLGQEGVATVQVCVDEKGRLTAMPTITQSSGTASLDDGAMKLAKAGSGHYRPTTEDGRPVSSCYEYRIGFHVRKDGR